MVRLVTLRLEGAASVDTIKNGPGARHRPGSKNIVEEVNGKVMRVTGMALWDSNPGPTDYESGPWVLVLQGFPVLRTGYVGRFRYCHR
jgi:hypothetical protein